MDNNRQALIAVNEAISCLDRAPAGCSVEGWADQAQMILLGARKELTEKEWPEMLATHNDQWLRSREFEQEEDGRL